MLCINDSVRITQNINSKKYCGEYIVYNSKTGNKLKIDYSCYLLIKEINENNIENNKELLNISKKYCNNYNDIINILVDHNIIDSTNNFKNNNILQPLEIKFPLTSLTLEITTNCNLKCKHCYGQFGDNTSSLNLSLDNIKSLKPALDKLHTRNIALTGGEVFVHKEFEEIVHYFLSNGFVLTIFTNGYNYERFRKFLDRFSNYHFSVKISLDGLEKTHNNVRGKEDAFANALKSLQLLSKYKNVNSAISTVVMKDNLYEINEFKKMTEVKFPRFNHHYDLVYPTQNDNQQKTSFSINEFDTLYKEYPFLFEIKEQNEKSKYRCAGGITTAALGVNKILRMCAAANGDCFVLGDLNQNDLYYIWTKPNQNCMKFRKEKPHSSKQCKKCNIKSKCNINDCRLLAKEYTSDMDNPNPLACFMVKKYCV